MGMCKECGNVVGVNDMVDGVCKTCLGDDEAIEKAKLVAEQSKNKNLTEDSYENKMIEAFVGKPDKLYWYTNSFSKFNVNGVPAMKWNWSWWAFFGGVFFLLYRKAYLAALVLLIATMTLGMIPFMGLIIWILTGGYSTYFVYTKYMKMKSEIESVVDDEEKRVETMKKLGGYNSWVIWVYTIFMIIMFIGILAAIAIPEMQNSY